MFANCTRSQIELGRNGHHTGVYAIKAKVHLGELTFRQRTMTNSQARLVGRYALEPEINLDAFNCRAVIDWVTICFWLGRTTQFNGCSTTSKRCWGEATRSRKQERRLLMAKGLKMKRPPRVGAQKAGTFLAYDELNGRVSDALRHLGARVAAAFVKE